MSVALSADTRSWLELPQTFPTASGELAQEWEDRVVLGMRDAWKGALNADAEVAVRQALRHGLERVRPEDSVTLQYWPAASVINSVVHVAVNEFGPDDVKQTVPLDDGPFVVEPHSSEFETETLGTGVESRALISIDTDPPMVVGALNYLFENSVGYVYVGIDPTLPALVGTMLEPLRDIVRSIRVTGTDGEPWEKCSVDSSKLVARGETWPSENHAEVTP